MKIEQAKQVAEIYRTKSINKAAHNLFIAQSTLSTSIHALEKEFEQEIFIRTQRGVETTAFGEHFIPLCNEMLDTYMKMQMLAERIENSQEKKRFNVAVYYLDFAIRVFNEFFNLNKDLNVEFQYHENSRSRVITYVTEGTSELGILMMPCIRKANWLELLHANGLEYYTLSVEEPKILVGNNNPIAQKKRDGVSMKELADYTLLMYGEENELFKTINRSIIKKYHIKHYIRLNGRGSLKEMLKETDGYHLGIFNKNAYTKYKYDDNITVLDLNEENKDYYEIGYVKKMGVPLSEFGKKYIQTLISILSL